MSEPSNLIEQAEALAGCRWDDPDNPNAMHALMGAMARALGTNPHGPRDDVAVGALLAHQMSPRGRAQAKAKAEAEQMLGDLLAMGLSPDAIAAFLGTKER